MGWRNTTLTILSGATSSEELNLTENAARRKKDLLFIAPTTLPETVTVHLAEAPGGTYQALAEGGSNVTLPAAKATPVRGITAGALKLIALAVAADRVFFVRGNAVD